MAEMLNFYCGDKENEVIEKIDKFVINSPYSTKLKVSDQLFSAIVDDNKKGLKSVLGDELYDELVSKLKYDDISAFASAVFIKI